ncbi:MBOAT family protein [Leptospira bourretii]|uniref:MBOAT family protein n=1 Tax=Leptospira bourretii TaxID=2484962 RepID=A0A4R9IQE3_9LEPT|nr:MBOAT family O-acyltransferase [Leptospira bourretii]TGK82860.1 MBOAT family protein [Leptospira bourretii]TGK94207.1 MBOAT family protein [Leptospira bourretii]TGL26151.1 MBOAT family protein [Leptospira bourretii]TGL28021.1 MBOAT family protein [Leptospira bourretii]
MLFNSFEFLVFFFVTIIVGNILKNRWQKLFFLLTSYYFYMAWQPSSISCTGMATEGLKFYTDRLYCDFKINPYVFILIFSTIIDYFAARLIEEKQDGDSARGWLLVLSLVVNIGTLGFFKYTDFLLGVINDIHLLGSYQFPKQNIILPVGISFYTFQSMSYTIDVYNRKIEARKSFLDFALYVAFFPQLVAGPIVRAETFFRDLDFRLGVYKENIDAAFALILIGFTRKIVFADNLARVVDSTFANYQNLNSIEIWTGALAFGWQIYFDFAGYTDIAIGVARLFGFQFNPNFNFPMSCRNIADHWSRWHISFSTWIRDYIYIPLGGSRVSVIMYIRNIMITWLFAGLWHGAAYHYVGWGIWQGTMLLSHKFYGDTKVAKFLNNKGGRVYDLLARIFTMFCLAFGFIMFRAETMEKAIPMMKALVFLNDSVAPLTRWSNYRFGILLVICFTASYVFSKRQIPTLLTGSWLKYTTFVIVNVLLLLLFGVTESQNFLYFQF